MLKLIRTFENEISNLLLKTQVSGENVEYLGYKTTKFTEDTIKLGQIEQVLRDKKIIPEDLQVDKEQEIKGFICSLIDINTTTTNSTMKGCNRPLEVHGILLPDYITNSIKKGTTIYSLELYTNKYKLETIFTLVNEELAEPLFRLAISSEEADKVAPQIEQGVLGNIQEGMEKVYFELKGKLESDKSLLESEARELRGVVK